MRQFRFKCITVNTNFILGPWSDPNLSDSPWIWFLVHIDGNCTFSEIKKKVSRRQTCECTITRCTSSAWYLRHPSDSPWFRGLILGLFHGRNLVHLFQLFLTNKTRRWHFHVECITICFEFYISLDHDSTQAFWLFMGLGITFSVAFWSKLGPFVPFLGGGGFVLQKYEKGSFPCLTENILVVIWFYWPVVRTHHIIMVTNDRYLVHLLHFYSHYREKGTFPRQMDYSISPLFWGGPWFDRTASGRHSCGSTITRCTRGVLAIPKNKGVSVRI